MYLLKWTCYFITAGLYESGDMADVIKKGLLEVKKKGRFGVSALPLSTYVICEGSVVLGVI